MQIQRLRHFYLLYNIMQIQYMQCIQVPVDPKHTALTAVSEFLALHTYLIHSQASFFIFCFLSSFTFKLVYNQQKLHFNQWSYINVKQMNVKGKFCCQVQILHRVMYMLYFTPCQIVLLTSMRLLTVHEVRYMYIPGLGP